LYLLTVCLGEPTESKKAVHVCCNILSSTADFTSVVEILKTRDRTEIISLILQAVEIEPLTRSKIMYQSMLNFTQVKYYASFLTQQGLLRYVRLDRKYAITDKGRQFLALFNETNKLLTTTPEDDGNNIAGDNLLQVQKHQPPQQQEVTVHK
jgi:predicted transcriptional regulator